MERGVPYEQVLRESVVEHEAFMANYEGNGTISDILRYSRRRRLESAAVTQNNTGL
jgi:hypothetical protein